MKKITQNLRWLVTLLAMIVCTGAWAQEVSYNFTGSDWKVENGALTNGTVSFTGEGSSNFKMNSGYFMMGKSGAYINFPTYGFPVEKIEVVGNSGASADTKMNLFVGSTAVSTETKGSKGTNTYEIASNYQAAGTQYTLKVTSSHNAQITAIKIYKASASGIAVPTFSLAGGTYTEAQSVTISCATEGASIYYTTDGSTPTTTNSTLYEGEITISKTTTLKAIASDGTNTSSVASATYTILTPITIAEARAQGTGNVFTSGIVTSCVGTTAFIEDATAGICVYGASLTVGDEIQVKGTLTTFNGLLEITSPTYTAVSHENVVAPTIKTIAEINSDYSGSNELQGLLVSIEDATVTAINGQNTTIAQGDNTIVVRGISGVTLAVNDVISLTGNIGCYNAVQIVNPTDVEVSEAPATPSITLSTSTINVSAEGGDGTIEVSFTAFKPFSTDIQFYESDGTTETKGVDWLDVEINQTTGNVYYLIGENTGEARTAYFKVYGMDEEMNELYSELITVTQAALVVDYATLPFEFNGGKANLPTGLMQSGLGSDYSASPKLKFDNTDDYLILKINEVPDVLTFDIKGNNFSGSTFTVQTSTNGKEYSDLGTYTELSDKQTEEFTLDRNVRYIKWIYTKKAEGNVALGNINVTKYSTDPQIILASTAINVDANENTGTLVVTYKNIDSPVADIEFCTVDGSEAEYDWIEADIDNNNNVYYVISANTGEARTAYFKVYALDNEANYVYSDIVTVTQEEYVIDYAELPFVFDEGKTNLPTGLTQSGLGSDYNSSPKLKFDDTDDNLILKINEDPGVLMFDIKGNSFSGGTFKVQTSTDGKNYSDLETYTELGNTQTEEFVLNSDVRYIKWIYTEKSGGNVALGNIKVMTLPSVSITIGESKWSTYVAEYHVQFPTGVSAFTVETINANSVTLGVVENNAVKKGTAVLVYSATPDTYSLELVNKNNCSDTSTNQLKAGPKTGDGTIYALANKDQGVGFYPVGNGIEVPAGKAYLDTSSAKNLVKGFLALGGLADAINNIAVENANGTIFNIAGQKVQNITKGGLYIVNGKKVFVK